MESITGLGVSVLTAEALSGFYGSETFFRHSLVRNVIFTEGCAYLCTNGAAWLIDEIAIPQNIPALLNEEFQSWELRVDENSRRAILVATDGGTELGPDGRVVYHELYRKEIPYTDFPLRQIKIFCCVNGEPRNGKTILLPSEY